MRKFLIALVLSAMIVGGVLPATGGSEVVQFIEQFLPLAPYEKVQNATWNVFARVSNGYFPVAGFHMTLYRNGQVDLRFRKLEEAEALKAYQNQGLTSDEMVSAIRVSSLMLTSANCPELLEFASAVDEGFLIRPNNLLGLDNDHYWLVLDSPSAKFRLEGWDFEPTDPSANPPWMRWTAELIRSVRTCTGGKSSER